jgi:hypothetical protein
MVATDSCCAGCKNEGSVRSCWFNCVDLTSVLIVLSTCSSRPKTDARLSSAAADSSDVRRTTAAAFRCQQQHCAVLDAVQVSCQCLQNRAWYKPAAAVEHKRLLLIKLPIVSSCCSRATGHGKPNCPYRAHCSTASCLAFWHLKHSKALFEERVGCTIANLLISEVSGCSWAAVYVRATS